MASMMVSMNILAQTPISGRVTGSHNLPVAGASISLENTYYGGTSGADGTFAFSMPDTGRFNLVITMIGYKKFEKIITAYGPPVTIQVILKEEISEMQAVTVSAGSFEATDKRRNTVLKPLDIVTTAGVQADVVAALKTLPGAQQVGETEGLFVRGGTGTETKEFIDGMLVPNPFFSSVPNIAQRGRFSPLLFKGTHFSSGGYSALYGQGLSSALSLETHDLPTRSETNLIISSAQLTLTRQQLNKAKNASGGFTINYNNLQPYYSVVPQKPDYSKAPEMLNSELFGRLKTKGGILKYYGYANYNIIAFSRPNIGDEALRDYFHLTNHNIFSILTYSGKLKDQWKINGGVGFNYNKDDIDLDTRQGNKTVNYFLPRLTNYTTQGRMVLTKNFAGLDKIQLGADYQYSIDEIVAKDSIPFITRRDNYTALFSEAVIYFNTRLVANIGLRYEYSSLLGNGQLSPRIALAWKLPGKGQLSAAYGNYYQKPETNLLFRKPDLAFMEAAHYILNYEQITESRVVRAEIFYKEYRKLVTYPSSNPMDIGNDGSGYAKGFEIFLRNKKLFKKFDGWIAYSFLDTKRKYLDYPFQVQPNFAAKHTVNLVLKRFVEKISTNFSMTYTYTTGRPYYNPNLPLKSFMSESTIDFHNLAFQVNYLTMIGKANTVFIFNVNNVIGNNQVYGYQYSSLPGPSGSFKAQEITPMAKRFYFIGAYLSIGVDRRKQVIDN